MDTSKWDWSDESVSDHLQLVVERLAKAGWITGHAMVTPAEVTLKLTDLGERQIKRLARAVRPFEDRYLCGGVRKPSFWDHLRFRFALAIHGALLGAAWMSHREDLALIVLLASQARKLRLSEG